MMRILIIMMIALQTKLVIAAENVQEISAFDLNMEYSQNEVKADAQYVGKTIIIYGAISDIKSGPILYIQPSINNWSIRCDLRDAEAGKVEKLNKSDVVGIKAHFCGKMLKTLILDKGVLLDTWKEKERQRQVKEREATLTKARKSNATNSPAVSKALSDDILNVPQEDPAAVLKAMIAKNPNDREAHAELGHMLFLKAKSDASQISEALTHLDKAVGDTLEKKVAIDNWEGQARFELAYIYFSQKKLDEAQSLINSIQDNSGNGSAADTTSTYRLLAGRLAESAGDDVKACNFYQSYLVPKMKKGDLSQRDLALYVHAWTIVTKHSRDDDPKYINLGNYCVDTWPGLEESVLSVKDPATIRQVVEILRKVNDYYPDKILNKLNAKRR